MNYIKIPWLFTVFRVLQWRMEPWVCPWSSLQAQGLAFFCKVCYLKLSMGKVRDVSNAYFKIRFSLVSFFFFGACLQVDLNNSPPESHSLTHPCIHIALLCKQNTEGHHDTTYSNIRAFPFTYPGTLPEYSQNSGFVFIQNAGSQGPDVSAGTY